MKYLIAILGFILFLIGFVLASRAYSVVCGCSTPIPLLNESSCYSCMGATSYQDYLLLFQIIMIISIFVVFYGFFSEFEYGKK